MARKPRDPVLITLLDQQQKTAGEYERWFSRLKRAFTRMDKLKKKLVRLARKIEAYQKGGSHETDRS